MSELLFDVEKKIIKTRVVTERILRLKSEKFCPVLN